MKSFKRILLCILCIIMLISSCSCDFIDELRNNSAERIGENKIVCRDNEYIKADINLRFATEVDWYESLTMIEEGEPLLYAFFVDEMGLRWSNCTMNEEATVINDDFGQYYFREDKYDELLNELKEFDDGKGQLVYDDYRLENGMRKFSEADSKLLLEVINGQSIPTDSIAGYEYNDWGTFYRYSENDTFYEYTELSPVECNGRYYIINEKYEEAYLASGRAEEILKELMQVINEYEESYYTGDRL